MAKSKKNRSFREWYEGAEYDYYNDDLDQKKTKLPSKKLSKQEQTKLERRKRSKDKRNFDI